MSDAPHIVQHPRPGISPEQASDARARAWMYVFASWHAKEGEQHVVTTNRPVDTETRPQKTEQEKT